MNDSAKRVVHFLETYCTLSKHPWNNQKIKLLPWQCSIISELYGTVTKDKDRLYKRASIWIPKKNGKTSLMAALGLYHLCEYPGSECYIIAANMRQANICFSEAANMADGHTAFKRLRVSRNSYKIEDRRKHSVLKVLSSEPHGLSGFDANLVIMDELAEWGSHAREAWDKLYSASVSRKNALHYVISTAQPDKSHLGYEQFSLAKRVKADPSIDPTLYPVVYQCPEDKWTDPAEWEKCNPSWGYTIKPDTFHDEYKSVLANPLEETRFKTYRLNIWAGHAAQWISQVKWADCAQPFNENDFLGAECIVGIDYARKHDLCSYVLLFEKEGKVYLVPRFFIPGGTAEEKQRADDFRYMDHARYPANNLNLTSGQVIDPAFLIKRLVEDSVKFKLREVAYDPAGMELIRQQLEFVHDLPMVEVPQTIRVMAPAYAQFERMVTSGEVRHNDNPILNWNCENCGVKEFGDKIMVEKNASTKRIDGITASCIALQRWMTYRERELQASNQDWVLSW